MLLVLAFALIVVAGCGGVSESGGDGAKLTLVAYSTPREVYADLTEDFAKTDGREGRDVRGVLRELRRAEPGRGGRTPG